MTTQFEQWLETKYTTRKKNCIAMDSEKLDLIKKTLLGLHKPETNFKSWIKRKGYSLQDLPQIGKHQVVCLKVKNILKNDHLDGYRQVAPLETFLSIISGTHQRKHGGARKVYKEICQNYTGIPEEAVAQFIKHCPKCQKSSPQETVPSMSPIIVNDLNEKRQLDVVDVRSQEHDFCDWMSHHRDQILRMLDDSTLGSEPDGALSIQILSSDTSLRSRDNSESSDKILKWRVGDRLEAMDYQDKWYTAKVVEVDLSDDTVLIHYDGWNSRYDQWLPENSERLRNLSRQKERILKEKKNLRWEFKVGSFVLAKWTDCRIYPAKVIRHNSDSTYTVMFYDGIQKNIQPINLKPLPSSLAHKKAEFMQLPKINTAIDSNIEASNPTLRHSLKRPHSLIQSAKLKESADKSSQSDAPKKRLKPSVPDALKKRRPTATSDAVLNKSPTSNLEGKTNITSEKPPSNAANGSSFLPNKRIASPPGRLLQCSMGLTFPNARRKHFHSDGSLASPKFSPFRDDLSKVIGSKISDICTTPESRTQETIPDNMLSFSGTGDLPKSCVLSSTQTKQKKHFSPPVKLKNTVHRSIPSANQTIYISGHDKAKKEGQGLTMTDDITTSNAVSLSANINEVTKTGTNDLKSSLKQTIPSTQNVKEKVEKTEPTDDRITTSAPDVLSTTSMDSASSSCKLRERQRSVGVYEYFGLAPVPAKEFVVVADHNPFKCDEPGCGKAFRKSSLLESHRRFYHSGDSKSRLISTKKRRKKTLSAGSSDSEKHSTMDMSLSPSFSIDLDSSTSSYKYNTVVPDSLSDVKKEKSLDEASVIDDNTEAEEESSGEIMNCICRSSEEVGLMVQCEVCLCWQHAECFDLTEETLPQKYVCFACVNPRRCRNSARYMYKQDWFKDGALPNLDFLPGMTRDNQAGVRAMQTLLAEMHNLSAVQHSIKLALHALGSDGNNEELMLWSKTWDVGSQLEGSQFGDDLWDTSITSDLLNMAAESSVNTSLNIPLSASNASSIFLDQDNTKDVLTDETKTSTGSSKTNLNPESGTVIDNSSCKLDSNNSAQNALDSCGNRESIARAELSKFISDPTLKAESHDVDATEIKSLLDEIETSISHRLIVNHDHGNNYDGQLSSSKLSNFSGEEKLDDCVNNHSESKLEQTLDNATCYVEANFGSLTRMSNENTITETGDNSYNEISTFIASNSPDSHSVYKSSDAGTPEIIGPAGDATNMLKDKHSDHIRLGPPNNSDEYVAAMLLELSKGITIPDTEPKLQTSSTTVTELAATINTLSQTSDNIKHTSHITSPLTDSQQILAGRGHLHKTKIAVEDPMPVMHDNSQTQSVSKIEESVSRNAQTPNESANRQTLQSSNKLSNKDVQETSKTTNSDIDFAKTSEQKPKISALPDKVHQDFSFADDCDLELHESLYDLSKNIESGDMALDKLQHMVQSFVDETLFSETEDALNQSQDDVCRNNLKRHVMLLQEKLLERLDYIEHHVTALEERELGGRFNEDDEKELKRSMVQVLDDLPTLNELTVYGRSFI